ncbi:hypothetical protein PHYPSEUDO_011110 [Phytophthora pseudosyringae]|uniref:BTB domain-containing protein n=1 Tax=Phytophthora pseudosyringae TaxID=221518 RepID=A0A8T1W5C2_9STRA|nr:hypothetical protein PHYPSEUDO_011110 [Phytophthora pseudosyringae]
MGTVDSTSSAEATEVRAAEMLEEMIKSTHQLDEILQRMCAAESHEAQEANSSSTSTTVNNELSESDPESDAEFEDCIVHGVGEVTAEQYLESVRSVFRAAGGGKIEIAASALATQASLDAAGGDLAVRFASCTRDTSFVFPTRTRTASGGDFGASVAASPPPECSVSYSYFLSRLRQQMVACDHIVPLERADEAAQLAFLLLEEQQRRLLGAISNRFPYQRESVYWVQGNRVCEVFVQETEQNNQWGLLLQLNVASHLRARVGKGTEDGTRQDPSDPGLSSCTKCMVFLPKTHYQGYPGKKAEIQTSIAVELSLYDAEQQGVRAEESGTRARNCSEGQTRATASAVSFHRTSELPEMVSVSLWGTHDDNPILDTQSSTQPKAKPSSFREVEIETPFPRNRIVQAACSRFHTLFLNDMGLVFAYGHTMDGALGLGDERSGYIAKPTLVDYFFDKLIVVEDIACGGDQLAGAHSAAVSRDGALFTWGVGIALGRGTLRSASTPQRIDLPSIEANPGGAAATRPPTSTACSVSCGSGFCVALTREGHAFSWGKWSDGRLGLGRIPVLARTSRRHGGGAARKQFQSFQLTPRQIQNVHTDQVNTAQGVLREDALFSKVICGDAHCVGLTRTGELVTWGRGNNGQQGRCDANDALAPTAVFKRGQKHWQDVAAGENWSMALSRDGQVWTWGACGGAVLGHGLYGSQKNALLAETILQRHQRLISQRKKSSGASSSCPRLPQLKWMAPQLIPCFSAPDIRICRISAGVQHAAAISETGDLYMWGEGNADTSMDSASLVLSSLPKLVNSGQRGGEGGASEQYAACIGTHSVEHVVCGGRHTIAFTSGSFLARSMSKLYRDSHEIRGKVTCADLVLIVSGERLVAHKLLLAQRSPVLRELILNEEQQQQDRLTASEGDDTSRTISGTEPMELLLPRLRVDVARALVEFIYTDNFTLEVTTNSYYLVHDVLRAAKLYKLPSLVLLCRGRLFSASPSSLFGTSAAPPALDAIAEEEELSDTNSEEDGRVPENGRGSRGAVRTLNDDMKFALSDEVWADTVLVAEGRSIPVHRCMLIARSEYFRAVLSFRRSTASLTEGPRTARNKTIVNVEDSYAGIARVLRFIYYDQVALPQLKTTRSSHKDDNIDHASEVERGSEDDASDQVLEDLVAADKYGLERMKRLCEHALCVTTANCLEVLAVAELVHAAHLKQVAMRFVQTHLADVTARREEFRRFQQDFPQLLEELYASLRDASRDEFLLREWYTEVGTSLAAQRGEQELQWGESSSAATFPWVPLSLTVAFGTMYLSMTHAQEHEYSAVPATNLVAIAAIGGAIMMGYL